MKRFLFPAVAVLAMALAGSPAQATDIGVSVTVSQPGVYGRIDIGPQPPAVIYPQPVIIGRPVVAHVQPVYMWVPPGHSKNWGKHCHRYNACGVPVYFVRDDPYRGGHHEHRGKHDRKHEDKHKHRD